MVSFSISRLPAALLQLALHACEPSSWSNTQTTDHLSDYRAVGAPGNPSFSCLVFRYISYSAEPLPTYGGSSSFCLSSSLTAVCGRRAVHGVSKLFPSTGDSVETVVGPFFIPTSEGVLFNPGLRFTNRACSFLTTVSRGTRNLLRIPWRTCARSLSEGLISGGSWLAVTTPNPHG